MRVARQPLVRRAAVKILGTPAWAQNPRSGEWALNHLADTDRAVRVEAMRIVRRSALAPKQIARLRLIVDGAPPGIRPGLLRLLEIVERRTRR